MSVYKGWWSRKVRKARAAGTLNGQSNIPSIEATQITDWEFQVLQGYETVARKRKVKFDKLDSPLKDTYRRLKSQTETMKGHFDKKAKLRPLIRPVSSIAAWAGIFSIILLELPINWVIFSAVTGESDILAGLLAFMTSLLFAYWGHTLGVHIRHGRWFSKLGVHILGASLTLSCLVALAYVRVYVFTDPEASLRVSAWLVQKMDIRAVAALFLALNVLLVLISGWLGYESHDADQEYEEAFKQYKHLAKKLNKVIRKRAKVRADCVGDLGIYCDNCHELMHVFREANLLARQNKTMPAVWRDPGKLPDNLINVGKFDFDLSDNSGVD